jgi:tRNA pseudouridine55 synthase
MTNDYRHRTHDFGLNGILPIDKPPGWTSHDVVARVRRLAGQRQVGHAGTLDPLATGLLLVVLGPATRLSGYLMASPKAYCAEVVLGAQTNTDDAEGKVIGQGEYAGVMREGIEAVLPRFVGEILQVPPAYAAVKQGGQRLYVLARKGIAVQPQARTVAINALRVLAWEPPRLRLFVECGSGTYIRSIARDLGEALGTCAYLHALRRVRSGAFRVEEAASLERLEQEGVAAWLRRPDYAVLDLPAVVASGEDARRVGHGGAILLGHDVAGRVRLYDGNGHLLALAEARAGTVKPFLVFPERE